MRPEPDIRHVVMGYGVSGRHHAWIVRRLRGVRLVAIIDTDEATRTLAQTGYPECTVLSDLGLLASDKWDALSVCTPDQMHVEGVVAGVACVQVRAP
jgi:predicted dehydrogenase